jgi:CBS domain-containing protein
MLAHQIMTSDVITVGADSTIVEAADTMLRHHISGLPVVDAVGNLIGIISEGDFIRRAEIGTQRKRGRWLGFLVGHDRIASDFVHEHGRKVGEIMTPDPVTVTEDAPLDQIAQIMESNGIKRLPVVRGKRLVGMVTRSDFLAAVAGLDRHAPNPSVADDDLRRAVSAAIGQASWRPYRLNVSVRDGVVSLRGVVNSDKSRRAAVVAAENVPGVLDVRDSLEQAPSNPPPEEELGGGDFVSLQQEPPTRDDEPL